MTRTTKDKAAQVVQLRAGMLRDFHAAVASGDPTKLILCATIAGDGKGRRLADVWASCHYKPRHDECLLGLIAAAMAGDADKAKAFADELVSDIARMHVDETVDLLINGGED